MPHQQSTQKECNHVDSSTTQKADKKRQKVNNLMLNKHAGNHITHKQNIF